MMSLYETLALVKDPRDPSGLRFPMQPFLTMVVFSVMSGFNSMNGMAKFFDANKEELTEMFNLKHGVPKYTQTRTILGLIDFENLSKVFQLWALQHIPLEKGDWVSGDGKTLKSTVTNSQNSKQNFIAMVSLFLQKTGVVLATNSYENGKTGEGPALRDLVEILENKGVILTLDALHCQKKQ